MMKIPPKTHKILTAITYVVVAVLILFVSVILFFRISGRTFWMFDRTLMWVKTGSMEPTIPARSYILVKKIDGDDVKVGDIITFKSEKLGGELNTHRVVEPDPNRRIGANEIVTKGDNNYEKDAPINRDSVIGIHQKNLPVLSFFGRFFTTPVGITVTVLIVLAVMILLYFEDIAALVNTVTGKKNEKQKQEKFDELVKAEVERLKAQNRDTDVDGKND